MYARAPRNPDGSVVLTAYSLSRPAVYDEQYCQGIEQPLRRGISPRRQERIDALRALLAGGLRMDQLEGLAAARYGLSSRQVRDDVRQLQYQLDFDGYAMHQGTHNVQLLSLALQRRERIAELARNGPPPPRDEQPAESAAPAPEKPRAAQPRVKVPDLRLLADVEIDRCRLLGLNARERPKPVDNTLRWAPPQWRHPERCRPTPRTWAPPQPAPEPCDWPEWRDTPPCSYLSEEDRRPERCEAPTASEGEGEVLSCPRHDRDQNGNPSQQDISGRSNDGMPDGWMEDPFGYPPRGQERRDGDLDRMIEEDFARRDAKKGIRHTVAELWPGLPGRQRWKPPADPPPC